MRRAGVVRLMRIALRDVLGRYAKGGAGFSQAALLLKTTIPTDRLLDDVLDAALVRACLSDDPLPRTPAFAEQVKRARTRLPAVVDGAFRLLAVAAEHTALTARLAGVPAAWSRLAAELRAQRDALVYPGFLTATPWAQLRTCRATCSAGSPGREIRGTSRSRCAARRAGRRSGGVCRSAATATARPAEHDPELEAFRWLLEELRVSLFAQELKTPYPGLVQAGRKGVGGPGAVRHAERPPMRPAGRVPPTLWHQYGAVLQ